MIKTKKMNGKDLTPEQLQGLYAGLTQGGNPSVLNPPKTKIEEEKPDMRSKYAMINIIKNKLRAAGQRDPMVMAVDACEEKEEK